MYTKTNPGIEFEVFDGIVHIPFIQAPNTIVS